MSASADLQGLLTKVMKADGAITSLAHGRVYDRVPEETDFPYISFGPSDFTPDDFDGISGRVETIQIDVWSRKPGRVECKRIVDAAKAALHRVDGQLVDSALVLLRVTLARIIPDPDGETMHGIVTVSAIVEEHHG